MGKWESNGQRTNFEWGKEESILQTGMREKKRYKLEIS